uniref:Uncharacterized protein n=1 Tax=Globisporangium ultimum (strain ATCC 200006 / CBS 805.95 / DAOM BR144) TaxID=431595 RepID=K3X2C6_GLOUD
MTECVEVVEVEEVADEEVEETREEGEEASFQITVAAFQFSTSNQDMVSSTRHLEEFKVARYKIFFLLVSADLRLQTSHYRVKASWEMGNRIPPAACDLHHNRSLPHK